MSYKALLCSYTYLGKWFIYFNVWVAYMAIILVLCLLLGMLKWLLLELLICHFMCFRSLAFTLNQFKNLLFKINKIFLRKQKITNHCTQYIDVLFVMSNRHYTYLLYESCCVYFWALLAFNLSVAVQYDSFLTFSNKLIYESLFSALPQVKKVFSVSGENCCVFIKKKMLRRIENL